MINLVYVELESKVSGTALYGRSRSLGIGIIGVLELNRVVVALLPLTIAITSNGILVELRLIEDNNLRIGVYVGDILESLFLPLRTKFDSQGSSAIVIVSLTCRVLIISDQFVFILSTRILVHRVDYDTIVSKGKTL